MRVSEYYSLSWTQPSLDFVDVDIHDDLLIHVDPRALLRLPSTWGHDCVAMVQSFFAAVIQAIRAGDKQGGLRLLGQLREPNETRLGHSTEGARGRGVGAYRADELWDALSRSEAVQTGLLEHLEESALMVPGIDRDIVSDITTNIIREPLIEYTQAAAQVYGIPLVPDVDSGPLWNPGTESWYNKFVHLPVPPGGKLILVPKVVVRYRLDYDQDEYYRHYLLPELVEEELASNSPLVELLKNGKRRVTKKALMEKYGTGKSVLVDLTLQRPGVLRRYRSDKELVSPPLTHEELARDPGVDLPNWDVLLQAALGLPSGNEHAHSYEQAIQNLLYAVFYPALVNPVPQCGIHEGRKRIDITFTNSAHKGFFYWLALNYRAPMVFVECKNYGREIGNPELDQLSSRFSPQRGEFGILVCRSLEDKDLFLQRCRDTARDHRGYVLTLDDADIAALVQQRREPRLGLEFPLLMERFQHLIR